MFFRRLVEGLPKLGSPATGWAEGKRLPKKKHFGSLTSYMRGKGTAPLKSRFRGFRA